MVEPLVRPMLNTPALLDADAAAHIAATGATDVANIDAWVRGLKALGIWENTACWLMRASQNHGSGATVRSLGGLGSHNGTLVNSPTWAGDNSGVRFEPSGSLMTTDLQMPASPITVINVRKADVAPGDNAAVWFSAGSSINGRQVAERASGATANQNYFGYRGTWLNTSFEHLNVAGGSRTSRDYVSIRVTSATESKARRNTTTTGAASVTNWDNSSPSSVRFGFYPVNTAEITQSLYLYSTAAISDTTDAEIYALYKSTIGQGLGLP